MCVYRDTIVADFGAARFLPFLSPYATGEDCENRLSSCLSHGSNSHTCHLAVEIEAEGPTNPDHHFMRRAGEATQSDVTSSYLCLSI